MWESPTIGAVGLVIICFILRRAYKALFRKMVQGIKQRHLPLDSVEEERLNTYYEIDEEEVLYTFGRWEVEPKVAQTVAKFFVTAYQYYASPGESFTIIGTMACQGNDVYITTKKPNPPKKLFQKKSSIAAETSDENTIVLTDEAIMISGGVFLRDNVEGVTWRVSDIKDHRKVFIMNWKG